MYITFMDIGLIKERFYRESYFDEHIPFIRTLGLIEALYGYERWEPAETFF